MLCIFPFTQLLVLDHSYVITHFWPLGIDKTRFVWRSYFRTPPASYLDRFGQGHAVASSRDLFSEDSAVARSQYRALKSGGMKQLFLGENELVLRHTHEMIQAYPNNEAPASGGIQLPRRQGDEAA